MRREVNSSHTYFHYFTVYLHQAETETQTVYVVAILLLYVLQKKKIFTLNESDSFKCC
jgi:hypothetical protein